MCVGLPGVEPRCTLRIEGRDTPQPQVVCRLVCGAALGAKQVFNSTSLANDAVSPGAGFTSSSTANYHTGQRPTFKLCLLLKSLSERAARFIYICGPYTLMLFTRTPEIADQACRNKVAITAVTVKVSVLAFSDRCHVLPQDKMHFPKEK
jgi:hypothetical protein